MPIREADVVKVYNIVYIKLRALPLGRLAFLLPRESGFPCNMPPLELPDRQRPQTEDEDRARYSILGKRLEDHHLETLRG